MTAILVGVVVVCAGIVIALFVARRTPSSDDGVASFRKHLDALSPEARRQVIDRMTDHTNDHASAHDDDRHEAVDPDDPGVNRGS